MMTVTQANPDRLTTERVIYPFLHIIAQEGSEGVDPLKSELAITAMCCLAQTWVELDNTKPDDELSHGPLSPFWKADASWLGDDFTAGIMIKDDQLVASLPCKLLALAHFSHHLAQKLDGLMPVLKNSKTLANDYPLLDILRLFEVKKHDVSRENLMTEPGLEYDFLNRLANARARMKAPPTSKTVGQYLEMGRLALITGAYWLLVMEEREAQIAA